MKIDPRKYFAISVIAVACWASANVAEAATSYLLTPIGGVSPDDFDHISEATGLNDFGQAVGNVIGFRDVSGFIDKQGVVTSLSGDNFTRALAINAAGTAVGWTGPTSGQPRQAYSSVNGSIDPVTGLGGGSSEATGINAAGVIVGSSTTTTGETHAFSNTNGVATDLQTLGGSTSRATGINASGQVTGNSTLRGDTDSRAFISTSQGLRALGTLGGLNSGGNAINDAGEITGFAELATGVAHAVLYSGNSVLDLTQADPTRASVGFGINNAGFVAGAFTDASGSGTEAFVYAHGVVTDLNTVLDPVTGAGWTLLEARGINDKGQIVGSGYNADNQRAAFLLTPIALAPVPEPETSALMLSGLGLIGVALRRRRTAA